MTNDIKQFENEREKRIKDFGQLRNFGQKFQEQTMPYDYIYNFEWLGLPIIQFPQEMVAIQEIIWKTRPNVIIETGIARGGSLILSASILKLLDHPGKVIGIDIDIRPHNRANIEKHPLSSYIHLIEDSSIHQETVNTAKKLIQSTDKVMVILDSNHTHNHVLEELNLYAPLVTKDNYLIVMDTAIENMAEKDFTDRPWSIGNNPKTAVHQFLKTTDRFEIDESYPNKLIITVAPDGYLKCVQ